MSRFIPDRFVIMLLATLLLGLALPARGFVLTVAQDFIFAGVFALFFLHGLRLPRMQVVHAVKEWRVQAAMLGFSFIAMPFAGYAAAYLTGSILPAALVAGIVYLAVLPSTVQSAVSFTSAGGGNVAASVVGAAVSNLAGIVLTPALVIALIGDASETSADGAMAIKIATMLLLPFALGQLSQRRLGVWAARQKSLLSLFDRIIILMAVYTAFSGAVVSGVLFQVTGGAYAVLAIVLAVLLAFGFGGALLLGNIMGLAKADSISLVFAGSHKSIATGAPMAALLFGNKAGLIVIPLILYHIAQLVISAPVAKYFLSITKMNPQ